VVWAALSNSAGRAEALRSIRLRRRTPTHEPRDEIRVRTSGTCSPLHAQKHGVFDRCRERLKCVDGRDSICTHEIV